MSLKKNFLYSSILTVSAYLFPLLVYPYISRVLGLSNIGIVNFVDNLINYFVLISMMGINTVGIREIAAAKADKKGLSKTFMSLLLLTVITTGLAIVVLLISMYTISTLFPYRDMLYVGIVKLFFNVFLLEWFFIGLEEFKYITKRTLIIRVLYVTSIFVFIHQASDYKLYFGITVLAVVMNALVNVFYTRKFIHFTLNSVSPAPYVSTFMIMGVYALLTNVYTMLNAVWLGFVTNTDEVGYYTTATKLQILIMGFLNSFTNIVFPRVSALIAEGKKEEYWKKISQALDAIFMFSFPAVAFVITAGPTVLRLLVGDEFEGSYLPLRIITPLILVIGIEQVLIVQILMARHHDRIVLFNSIVGALTMIMANFLITKTLGAPGSAIVWVLAETTILMLAIIEVSKKEGYVFPVLRLLRYCLCYAPLLAILAIICNISDNEFILLGSASILTLCYACIIEVFVTKNHVATQFYNKILKR